MVAGQGAAPGSKAWAACASPAAVGPHRRARDGQPGQRGRLWAAFWGGTGWAVTQERATLDLLMEAGAASPPQQPDLAADLFELQHRIPGRKRHRSPKINEQQAPELRPGFYGVGDGRGHLWGKRPRIGVS